MKFGHLCKQGLEDEEKLMTMLSTAQTPLLAASPTV